MGSKHPKPEPPKQAPKPAEAPPPPPVKIVHGDPIAYQGRQVQGVAMARNQNEAYELDAADGVIDGKYYGAEIRIAKKPDVPDPAPSAATYHSLPAHRHAAVPRRYNDQKPLYPVPVEEFVEAPTYTSYKPGPQTYLTNGATYTSRRDPSATYGTTYAKGGYATSLAGAYPHSDYPGKVISVEYRTLSGRGAYRGNAYEQGYSGTSAAQPVVHYGSDTSQAEQYFSNAYARA